MDSGHDVYVRSSTYSMYEYGTVKYDGITRTAVYAPLKCSSEKVRPRGSSRAFCFSVGLTIKTAEES